MKKQGGSSQAKTRWFRAGVGAMILLGAVGVILAVSSGCSSSGCVGAFKHSPFGNAKESRRYLESYQNVLLVRVTENHAVDRGPNRLGILHFKGAVAKVYKGDWKVSEPISFVHYVDYQPSATVSNEAAGAYFFVFSDVHTNAEFEVETGDFTAFDAEMERMIDCVFAGTASK